MTATASPRPGADPYKSSASKDVTGTRSLRRGSSRAGGVTVAVVGCRWPRPWGRSVLSESTVRCWPVHTGAVSPDRPVPVRVELLYVEGCPGWTDAAAMLERAGVEFGFTWTPVLVESDAMAASLVFHGSPSVHVDGVDLSADPVAPIGLACRLYRTEHGVGPSPDPRVLSEALRAALPTGRRE